ncbi:MAG: hypothetical protein M3Y42_15315, partial [Actinomycetota bacterium]|nr:hypothetical protein [Actinomycetota bacterium]
MHRQSRSIRQIASATGFVRARVLGNRGPAAVLGAFPTACYLQLTDGTVIALLCSDAVRLPIGLVLPVSSRQLPLDRVFAAEREGVLTAELTDGELRLGGLRVGLGSIRSAALAPVGQPVPES